MYNTAVRRVGNSLRITLPKTILENVARGKRSALRTLYVRKSVCSLPRSCATPTFFVGMFSRKRGL